MLKRLLIALLCLSALPARAQTGARYILTNDTGTTGGSFFPVTTLVTFNSLNLTQVFADSTSLTLPLLIGSTPTTSLTPLQLTARTAATDIAAHGGVVTTTISGTFSRTAWQVANTVGGAKTNVTVLPDFSATLTNPDTNSLISVYGVDSSTGALYRAGQFNTQAATLPAAVTPEPGAFALLVSGGLAGAWWKRRRQA